MIQVRLFATFREDRFKDKEMDFPESSPVADLFKQLNIPAEQVGILLVNGQSATPQTKLKSNDVVSIFPAIGGG